MNEAERRRDEGIRRAYDHALETWKAACMRAIRDLARVRFEFTTDAVWTLLDQREVVPVREPRAIAGVLRRAQTLGYIEPTGVRVKSVLPRGHARYIQVYHSLIYGEEDGARASTG